MKTEVGSEKNNVIKQISRGHLKASKFPCFKSFSYSLLKSDLANPEIKSNHRHTVKNLHIPSIFKNHLINHSPKEQNRVFPTMIQSMSQQVIKKEKLTSQTSQMTLSLGLPSTKYIHPSQENDPTIKYSTFQKINISRENWKLNKWLNISTNRQQKKLKRKNQPKKTTSLTKTPQFIKKKTELPLNLSQFQIIRELGTIGFGEYFQAIHCRTNFIVCLKRLKKSKIIQNGLVEKVIKRIKRNIGLDHPNIRQLYGIFDDEHYLYLILQSMDHTTLNSYITLNHNLSESESALKMRQIGEAIQYLHEKQLVNRVISSKSILMTHGVVKISDFDLMMVGGIDKCPNTSTILQQNLNSQNEGCRSNSLAFSYDMWRLGLLAYEMMTGKSLQYPLDSQSNRRVFKIDSSRINFPAKISELGRSFILDLLEPIPKNRITVQQMLKSPFIVIRKDNRDWNSYLQQRQSIYK